MEIYCVKVSGISEEEIENLCLLIDFEKKSELKNLKIRKIRLGH